MTNCLTIDRSNLIACLAAIKPSSTTLNRYPLIPGVIVSIIPPELCHITGHPVAIASMYDLPKDSCIVFNSKGVNSAPAA